jgi:putative phosphoribosyl transferase
MRFRDRAEAGQALAEQLQAYSDRPDVVVLALPRGGVPVAYEVATRLNAPLDVFLVRKLGVPGREELAMGALATGGVRVLNESVIAHLHIADDAIEAATERERAELERREHFYRGEHPARPVHGWTVILVDDGLATGSTMRAAVAALRERGPARVIVAVPAGAPEACDDLRAEVDEIVCVHTPDDFRAVGLWYENFEQTTDEEVRDLLIRAAHKLTVTARHE